MPRLGGTWCSRHLGNIGLIPFMNVAFGEATKMLTGKKYPQNRRALCMVAEEFATGYHCNWEISKLFTTNEGTGIPSISVS